MNEKTTETIDFASTQTLRRFDAHMTATGVRKKERIVFLAQAYLLTGPLTDRELAGMLIALGYDRRRCRSALRKKTGGIANRHKWPRGINGLLLQPWHARTTRSPLGGTASCAMMPAC